MIGFICIIWFSLSKYMWFGVWVFRTVTGSKAWLNRMFMVCQKCSKHCCISQKSSTFSPNYDVPHEISSYKRITILTHIHVHNNNHCPWLNEAAVAAAARSSLRRKMAKMKSCESQNVLKSISLDFSTPFSLYYLAFWCALSPAIHNINFPNFLAAKCLLLSFSTLR